MRRLVLRGGLVADGIGTGTRPADVLITGTVLEAITGPGAGPADAEVIELTPGSVVCPGFIDAHAHAEGALLADGGLDGALAQGVTTLVVGQDGQSWIGASEATAGYLNQYFAPVNGVLDPARTLSVAAYRDAVTGRLRQNVAILASQGTIRHNVAGLAPGPLAPGPLAAARREVESALAEGAVGLSSGLDYLPSRLGLAPEIAELARPLAGAGRPYVSHLRGYGPDVAAGLAELTQVGRRAGVAVHASHLWGRAADIDAAFRAADDAGVPLSYDSYPYRRSSSVLPMIVLPAELQAGGIEATLAALADPARRAGLLATDHLSEAYLAGVFLGSLPDDLPGGGDALAGQSVARAAAAAGQPAGQWALDLLARTRLRVGAHLDRPSLTAADLAWLAAGDRQCGGSDGIYIGQHPHPRGYAAFARLARQYLDQAEPGEPGAGYQVLARHLARRAAEVYGLRDRGRLAAGHAADLCVLAPAGPAARATYAAPAALATGVDLVLVNGAIAWPPERRPAGARPGQVVS